MGVILIEILRSKFGIYLLLPFFFLNSEVKGNRAYPFNEYLFVRQPVKFLRICVRKQDQGDSISASREFGLFQKGRRAENKVSAAGCELKVRTRNRSHPEGPGDGSDDQIVHQQHV